MSKLFYLFAWSFWFTRATLAATTRDSSVSWIVPGAIWYDTDGVRIDAHGGQVLKSGNTFYWIGSSYNSSYQPRIYSSTDLLNWVNLGIQYPIINMFRPKLFRGISDYFILGQISNDAQQLYSSEITGVYSKGEAYTVPPDNYTYTDEGVFVDNDGTTYFLASCKSNNLQINELNGDGTIGTRLSVIEAAIEAPGMFRVDDVYFLIVSSKTGYTANPNKVYWSTSLSGPWTGPADIAPEAENTYNSQNSHELVITGTLTTTYIYLGDVWDSDGTANSNYMWLPITANSSANTVNLQYEAMWKIDVDTGIVSIPEAGKRYEAGRAEIVGRGAVVDCDNCVYKHTMQDIDTTTNITFKNVHGTGATQWVSIHYTTNQNDVGDVYIWINDDTVARKISDYNSRAGYYKTTPIQLRLELGPVNTIKFGCNGYQDFKIHFDGIEVHQD